MANIIWNPGINAYNPTVELIVNQSSQSVDGNYSVLSYSLILHRPSNVSSSASKSYSVAINGVTVASGTTTLGGSGDKIITSGTTTVYHNADGTKSGVGFSFYMDIGITWSGSGTGNASGSGTMNLTTIPRATQPTLSAGTVTIGNAVTINTPRASDSFSHKLFYKWAGGGWELIASDVGTSYAWTTPMSLCSGIPNSTSGTITIAVDTYNGSTFIGTKTIDLTLNVPSSVVPTVSISKSGVDLYSSKYVQGRSKVAVTLTDSGAYGSSIMSRFTSVKSGTNVISTSTSNTFTSGVINYSGEILISTVVTDSRGRTATASTTITVVAYWAPVVTAFSAFRANSNGSANPQGAYIRITGSASISPIDNTNTKSTILRYRLKGASSWTDATWDTSSYTPSLAVTIPANVNSSFEVQIYTADYFTSTTQGSNVGTAFVLMDFRSTGKGVAFGKVSEMDAFEINMPGFLNGNPIATTDLAQMIKLTNDAGSPKTSPADLNSLVEVGVHSSNSTTLNRPDSFGLVYVTRRTSQHVMQLFHSTSNWMYTRISLDDGANWTAWRSIGDYNLGVVESGYNANGRYVKFGNGTLMCWGIRTFSTTVASAWGSLFYHDVQSWTFPSAFVDEKPVCSAFCTDGNAELLGMVPNSTLTNMTFYGLRPTSVPTSTAFNFRVFAIGRWK